MSSEDISAFLNQTITSRLGIRLIAEQYVAISQSPVFASTGTPTPGNKADLLPGGIIDPECSPERMVRMCAAFVSSLCEATFGTSPDIKIDGVVDAPFITSSSILVPELILFLK
jgi:26S proteasome regulatory subunit T1